MRALRRSVPLAQRAACARAVARHAARSVALRAGARVALYAALPEELDTTPLLEWVSSRGFPVYLPRIEDCRHRLMRFCLASGQFTINRYGIREPLGTRCLAARWFDVVFLPLVAFDGRGARLGMGSGYYDRALAFRHARASWGGPLLVGLAYAFQQVEALTAQPHDVRLDAVITERGLIRFPERLGQDAGS